jgi:hypothetical protein
MLESQTREEETKNCIAQTTCPTQQVIPSWGEISQRHGEHGGFDENEEDEEW